MNTKGRRKPSISLIALLTWMLVIASSIPRAGHFYWIADLFAHFAPHYLVAGVLLLAGLVWKRRMLLAAFALLVVVWNGYLLSPYFISAKADLADDGASLDLLQFNVSRTNPAPLATIGYIQSLKSPPDVIILTETTRTWAPFLKLLRHLYPTVAQMPREDNFGMAVLSRLPESEVDFREAGAPPVPLMLLSARVEAESVHIYAVHPPPPLGVELSAARNAQLRALAEEIRSTGGANVIVAGDFNATVWSTALAPLLADAALRDAQRGHGYLPTWSPSPLSRWVGIPIDLTLVSADIFVAARDVGPWLGSDHWPVRTRLSLR